MKIRCDLHIGNQSAKLILVPKPEEKDDHLALKLAATLMFFTREPIVDPSSNHPALLGFEHKPDVCALDAGGQIDLWIDCGSVTAHKLDKVTRRLPNARIVVIKSSMTDAARLRRVIKTDIRHAQRVEIWAWPNGTFEPWLKALAEKTEVYGEAHEKSLNLVVNEVAYTVDLVEI
ncbi:MAG: YaeQ family protein [Elusimicrobia bacterium]|nr:YaeQ family protein [Candidatus Obscuribacterium magneticum]